MACLRAVGAEQRVKKTVTTCITDARPSERPHRALRRNMHRTAPAEYHHRILPERQLTGRFIERVECMSTAANSNIMFRLGYASREM